MKVSKSTRSMLDEYRQALLAVLGDELDSVVLYGSQARGHPDEGSDVDVLCIMKKQVDYGELIKRTSEVTAQISLKYDVVVSRAFICREDYDSRRTPFLMNVRKDQIAI